MPLKFTQSPSPLHHTRQASGTSFKTRRMRNFNNPPTADAAVAVAIAVATGECKVNFVAWLNLSWQLCGKAEEGKGGKERERKLETIESWDEPYSSAWYICMPD